MLSWVSGPLKVTCVWATFEHPDPEVGHLRIKRWKMENMRVEHTGSKIKGCCYSAVYSV